MKFRPLAIWGALLGAVVTGPLDAQAQKPDAEDARRDRHSGAARRAHRRLRRAADREGAGLHRRRRLAAEAAQQLDHRPGRRSLCRARRPYLDLPAAAHADQRRGGADRVRPTSPRTESRSTSLGFPRPYGVLGDCCLPAPSVMEFDANGKLLRAWGGPADPDKCKVEDGCVWPASEHGIFVDHNGFVYLGGNSAQRQSERLRLGVDQRRRRHDPEVHQGRQVRDDDRRLRAPKGRTATTRMAAATARRCSICRPTSPSIRPTTACMFPTATAIGAWSSSMRRPASTSAISAPTATTRSTTRPRPPPAPG